MGEEADEAMMFESFTTCRKLVTAVILVFGVSMLATAANAQQVVVIVNGDPITALDIEQRSKLIQASLLPKSSATRLLTIKNARAA